MFESYGNRTNYTFSEELPCNSFIHQNHTLHLGVKFGYIPETLLINVITWVVLLLLFAILRKNAWNYGRIALVQKNEQRWTQLFYGEVDSTVAASELLHHKDSTESVDIIVRIDQGFCSWLTAIFKIKDEHILKKCGQDAIQYLTFQRYIIVFVSIVCFVCLTIILPVNFQGTLEGDSTTFGHTTISNLSPNSALFWIHVIFAFLFLPLGIYLMRHFSVNLKYENQDFVVKKTLMITHIPPEQCSHDVLLEHFSVNKSTWFLKRLIGSLTHAPPHEEEHESTSQSSASKTIEAYPDCLIQDIQFAYDVYQMMKLDQRKLAVHEAKIWCEDYLKVKGTKLQMRPYKCSCLSDCCAFQNWEQVDAIEFYEAEEQRLAKNIEQEKLAALRQPLGIAFVTFQTRQMASSVYKDHQTSCKCGQTPPGSKHSRNLENLAWGVFYASPPEDIYWENLSSNTENWYLRALFVNCILFVVLFFLTTPAWFVNSLVVPISWFQNKLESVNPLLSEFIPTIFLWVVAALLPVIVSYSDQFLYHWSRSEENHSVMRKTFLFLLFMVVVLPSLGLTSAKAFVEWVVEKPTNETTYRWQCIFLPDNGAFFVNYVITSAFIGTALELIRFPELFMFMLRLICARSPAERARVHKCVLWQFPFGTQYAWMLLNVSVTILYSLPCPMIAIFGLVYIILKHCVDRYNIYFAYGPSKINKEIHVTAINFVIITISLLQVVIFFFLFIRAGAGLKLSLDGAIVWISLIGCILSILILLCQLFLNLFQRFSPVHQKGQTEVVICEIPSLPDQMVRSDIETDEVTLIPKFVPSVLQPSQENLELNGGGQPRSYGTRNTERFPSEDSSICSSRSLLEDQQRPHQH